MVGCGSAGMLFPHCTFSYRMCEGWWGVGVLVCSSHTVHLVTGCVRDGGVWENSGENSGSVETFHWSARCAKIFAYSVALLRSIFRFNTLYTIVGNS